MNYSILLVIGFIIASIVPALAPAYAQDPTQVNSVLGNILDVTEYLVAISFTLAVVVFGWGIVQLIYAAGDPGRVQKAKGIITWGIIAMFILASIFGIIEFIQNYFGIDGGGGIIEPPQIGG